MAVGAQSSFDKRLVEIYYDKKTIVENTDSKDNSADVLNYMELISVNRKAMMNFKVKTRIAA